MRPVLSILTPAIWRRLEQSTKLHAEVGRQCLHRFPRVEHLVLLDDQTRTVGMKRQALLDAALGDYIAYVDDDDWISPDYVQHILTAAVRRPDVITFRQCAVIDGQEGEIDFRITARADAPFQAGQTVQRPPWHVCAWRRDLVGGCVFPDINDGEDIAWCHQARAEVRSETHIDRVLHTYRFSSATTAATGR